MKVTGFDHLVLAVSDVERSIAWYRDVLGLEESRVDEWRRGEAPFPSVRINADTIIDLIPAPDHPAPDHPAPDHPAPNNRRPETSAGVARNVDHICLVVEPTDLEAWARQSNTRISSGPGPRSGAQGIGTSIYITDPDGNTVELRHY